jgi:hypothetical protein
LIPIIDFTSREKKEASMNEENIRINEEKTTNLMLVEQYTIRPQATKASGSGKAFQAVAQSAAMAVQDATDHLRNMSAVSTTAVGSALAQLLAEPDKIDTYQKIIGEAQGIVGNAAGNFKNVGNDATNLLLTFPPG